MICFVYASLYNLFQKHSSVFSFSDQLSNQLTIYFCVNPYLPRGLFHPCQLDESISKLWVFGVLLHFYFISNRTSCKQTV